MNPLYQPITMNADQLLLTLSLMQLSASSCAQLNVAGYVLSRVRLVDVLLKLYDGDSRKQHAAVHSLAGAFEQMHGPLWNHLFEVLRLLPADVRFQTPNLIESLGSNDDPLSRRRLIVAISRGQFGWRDFALKTEAEKTFEERFASLVGFFPLDYLTKFYRIHHTGEDETVVHPQMVIVRDQAVKQWTTILDYTAKTFVKTELSFQAFLPFHVPRSIHPDLGKMFATWEDRLARPYLPYFSDALTKARSLHCLFIVYLRRHLFAQESVMLPSGDMLTHEDLKIYLLQGKKNFL